MVPQGPNAEFESKLTNFSVTLASASAMTATITKADIVKAVEELPENATLEDAIERMVFLHKIQRGLQQVEAGETRTLAEVKAHFKQRRAKG